MYGTSSIWRLVLILLLGAGLTACSSTPLASPRIAAQSKVINWAPSVDPDGLYEWMDVAAAYFDKPIIILGCHGLSVGISDDKQVWLLAPEGPRKWQLIDEVARTLHNLYPNHIIVLIVCNEARIKLNMPGVYYALDIVWSSPGDDWRFGRYAEGDIEDFVTWVSPIK